MRFSATVTALLVSSAAAHYNGSYGGNGTVPVTTEVVTDYTTYCPGPTTISYGSQTFTVTEPTTITVTGPCTITRPIETSVVTECNECPPSTAVPPPPAAPPVYPNGSAPAPPPPSGTASNPGGAPAPTFTAAASHAMAGSGAGLAALFGLAAFLL